MLEVEWVKAAHPSGDAIVYFNQDVRLLTLDPLNDLENAFGMLLHGQGYLVPVVGIPTGRTSRAKPLGLHMRGDVAQEIEHEERNPRLRQFPESLDLHLLPDC